MIKIVVHASLSFLLASSATAQDCLSVANDSMSLPNHLPTIDKDFNFWTLSKTKTSVCYDKKLFLNGEETLAKFNGLKAQHIFDESNCLNQDLLNNKNGKDVTDVMIASLHSEKNPMKLYALQNSESGELVKVVLTNSSDKNFASNALTAQDKWELAGVSVASSAVGIMVERKLFAGQHDKDLHANYGAVINLGTNLASYAVIEEMGVGERLNLTRDQKKMAILLSGTVMGLIVGYAKERFYEYYRRQSHTYDPHLNGDMGATMLGSGALTPFYISFKYAF